MATEKTDDQRTTKKAPRKKAAKTTPRKKLAKRSGVADRGECFVIMPLDKDRSTVREKAEGLLESVIRPALLEIGFKAVGPLDVEEPGSVTLQVLQRLLRAPLIVANVTGKNANVMYELAIRHAKRLPVVCMAEEGSEIPFDVLGERFVPYQDTLFGVAQAKLRLKESVLAALAEKKPDNPVYRATDALLIRESKAIAAPEKLLLKMLSELLAKRDTENWGPTVPLSTPSFAPVSVVQAVVSGDATALDAFSRALFASGAISGFTYEILTPGADGTTRRSMKISGPPGKRLTLHSVLNAASGAGVRVEEISRLGPH